MSFGILCPDGKERLVTNWATQEEADFDARYFSGRTSCRDWCSCQKDCPGGHHQAVNNSLVFVYPDGL